MLEESCTLPIIESIVSQHAEEAAFLWLLRDAAIAAPHYSLPDLADLDERVEAHIDGLRVARDAGWASCAEGLQQQESGEVFAAAVIALEGNQSRRLQQVYATVASAPETLRGLISGIGWIDPQRLKGKIAALLESDTALWRRVGIAACAVHRVDCGEHLSKAIEDPDVGLSSRALRAAGETGRRDLLPALRRQMQRDDPQCTFWAAWSAVLLGDRDRAVAALKQIAMTEHPLSTRAIQLLLRILDADASTAWLRSLSTTSNRRRDLIIGCGTRGDPAYVPWLIQRMAEAPEDARIAAEAFTMITGLDLAYQDLDGDQPDAFHAGPTESAADQDVSMDPDEDLPWPDATRIQAWWEANRVQFGSGTRYLAGQPITASNCAGLLTTGMQRQRIAAALELALIQADAPLFETRAPGRRQQALLASQ